MFCPPDLLLLPINRASCFQQAGPSSGKSEVLSRFTVIIDYPHKAIYFQRSEGYKKPFIFSKTGFTLVARGPELKTKVIADIRKDSPAEKAGILKNDVLFKINGQKADNMLMHEISPLLRRRDGKKVRLVLLRNGEKVKIKFRLRDII